MSALANAYSADGGAEYTGIFLEMMLQRAKKKPFKLDLAELHAVCEANHDRLVDPDNPDLIMPGQQIALPPVPASP